MSSAAAKQARLLAKAQQSKPAQLQQQQQQQYQQQYHPSHSADGQSLTHNRIGRREEQASGTREAMPVVGGHAERQAMRQPQATAAQEQPPLFARLAPSSASASSLSAPPYAHASAAAVGVASAYGFGAVDESSDELDGMEATLYIDEGISAGHARTLQPSMGNRQQARQAQRPQAADSSEPTAAELGIGAEDISAYRQIAPVSLSDERRADAAAREGRSLQEASPSPMAAAVALASSGWVEAHTQQQQPARAVPSLSLLAGEESEFAVGPLSPGAQQTRQAPLPEAPSDAAAHERARDAADRLVAEHLETAAAAKRDLNTPQEEAFHEQLRLQAELARDTQLRASRNELSQDEQRAAGLRLKVSQPPQLGERLAGACNSCECRF